MSRSGTASAATAADRVSLPKRVVGTMAVAAVLAVARPLARLGLWREVDGWRRITGVALRAEASKFILSAFGLDLWTDTRRRDNPDPITDEEAQVHCVERLWDFLRREVTAYLATEWTPNLTRVVRNEHLDLVLGKFSPSGELVSIRSLIDQARGAEDLPAESVRRRVEAAVAKAYNLTRHTPDITRPVALQRTLEIQLAMVGGARGETRGRRMEESARDAGRQSLRRTDNTVRAYADRLLSGWFVSFEEGAEGGLDGDGKWRGRFAAPDFKARKGFGPGAFNVVCRLTEDRRAADLWLQIHRAAIDGAAAQELLARLEAAWGVRGPILYPAAEEGRGRISSTGEGLEVASTANSRPEVWEAHDFVDFSPLLGLRKELNRRLAVLGRGDVTAIYDLGLGCVLLWRLAKEPEFHGVKFGLTVDVPAIGAWGRGVGLVVIRPGDYLDKGEAGFMKYALEFNRQLALTRAGRSPVRRAMRTLALLPPGMQAMALRQNVPAMDDAFGAVVVSLIKDARVFIGSMPDIGLTGGFIALGSMALPAEDGGRVTSVSVKGPKHRIAGYPAAIRRMVDACRAVTVRNVTPQDPGLDAGETDSGLAMEG